MFRPFEADGSSQSNLNNIDDVAAQMVELSSFQIKAANLSDDKSKKLYQ